VAGGLMITPWHPIREITASGSEEWVFPADSSKVDLYDPMECDVVYSFVLETDIPEEQAKDESGNTSEASMMRGYGRGIMINHIECATMAHGIMNQPIISHPFYGTSAVANELKKASGWINGLVELTPESIIRDPESGLVCGFSC
jgi:hypothetical protein